MKRGTKNGGRGMVAGFVASILMLVVATSTTVVGVWIPLVGSSLHRLKGGAGGSPRKLAHDTSSGGLRTRVVEPVTVVTFFLNAKADVPQTITVDHYREEDDMSEETAPPSRMTALEQQSHRRLDPSTSEEPSAAEEEDDDAQASQLTRLLIPLVCVAIACLVAAAAILLFVVLVRTRSANPKIEAAGTVHHIPPVEEPSFRLPFGDIPLNETQTTANEASAGTPSAVAGNAGAGSDIKAVGWRGITGNGLLEAIRLRTRSVAAKFPFPPPPGPNGAPPQEVHRPNLLLTGIHRQPSVAARPDPTAFSPHPRHHPRDAVPLSIVSTMTNSFNNEAEDGDDDDVLDMDLDLYLGLAAAASSSSREWLDKGPSNATAADVLSSIEEGDSSSRQLVEEIHWQGSSDVAPAPPAAKAAAASASAADTAAAPDPAHESRSVRSASDNLPKPSRQRHLADALCSLLAAGVPPQAILGASVSHDASDSSFRGEQARSSTPRRGGIEAAAGALPQEFRSKHSRGSLDRAGRRSGTKLSAAAAAAVEPCRAVPRAAGSRAAAYPPGPTRLVEGRDDAEDSHAGSSVNGRSDTLLEL